MSIKTGAKRHTHKYHNVNGVWMCALANCTHYMPKNVAANIVGKNSLCWDCGSEFVLDEHNMQNEKPVCCSKDVDATLEFLRDRGI